MDAAGKVHLHCCSSSPSVSGRGQPLEQRPLARVPHACMQQSRPCTWGAGHSCTRSLGWLQRSAPRVALYAAC